MASWLKKSWLATGRQSLDRRKECKALLAALIKPNRRIRVNPCQPYCAASSSKSSILVRLPLRHTSYIPAGFQVAKSSDQICKTTLDFSRSRGNSVLLVREHVDIQNELLPGRITIRWADYGESRPIEKLLLPFRL